MQPCSIRAAQFSQKRAEHKNIGNGAWGYREIHNEIGAIQLGSLGELRQELDAVRAPTQALRPTTAQRVHFAPEQEGEVRVQGAVATVVTSEWIWEQDSSGRYIYSNAAVKDILGYEPEEVLGKHYLGLFTREYREYMAGDFPESTDPKHCFFRLINRYRHKDGHEVITESTGESIFDKEGKLIKWQGMDRDITACKRFEDALQQV